MVLKRNKFLICFVVVVLILGFLNIFNEETRGFFYSFSAPIQRAFWKAGDNTSDFFWGILRSGSLRKRVEELELRNQSLFSQIISLKELENENIILREALDLGLQNEFKLSFAQIIGKDISQDFILLNKGSIDGVSKDMPVITEEKVLVGRICEVFEKYSKVMLLSNKKSSFDSKVVNENLIMGVVKGMGNNKIILDLIPKESKINQWETVATTSISGIFPEGLSVGEIERIFNSDAGSFQQAEIKPFFDLSKAENLFIITQF